MNRNDLNFPMCSSNTHTLKVVPTHNSLDNSSVNCIGNNTNNIVNNTFMNAGNFTVNSNVMNNSLDIFNGIVGSTLMNSCSFDLVCRSNAIATTNTYNSDKLNGNINKMDSDIATNVHEMSNSYTMNSTIKLEATKFICQRCGKSFSSETELESHESTLCHEHPYSCIYCDKRFRAIEHMRVHLRVHTGERPYECQTCGKRFTQTSHLRSHELIHTGTRPYVCIVCDKAFKQKEHLKTHERVHSGLRPYSCSDCGKTFSQSSHLRSHQHIHSNTRPYTCIICSKAFAQSEHLRGHMRTHSGERPFTCSLCGKTFTHSAGLHKHGAVHKNRLFPCLKCGAEIGDFATIEALNEHEDELHDGKRQYECQHCDMSYSFLSTLRTHEKLHVEEKPHICDVCQKAFKQVEHLRVHVRTHTGEKPFPCRFCDKSFAQTPHLRTHERLYHKEECSASIEKEKAMDGYSAKRKTKDRLLVRINPRLQQKQRSSYVDDAATLGLLADGERLKSEFACDACGEGFAQEIELIAHLQSAHGTGDVSDILTDEHLEECDEDEVNRLMYDNSREDYNDDDDDNSDDNC